MNPSLSKFGARLATLRKQAHLSQQALADLTELSRNYIALLEGGQRLPSLDTALRLAKALSINLKDLISVHKNISPKKAKPPKLQQSEKWHRLVGLLRRCSVAELNLVERIVAQTRRSSSRKSK